MLLCLAPAALAALAGPVAGPAPRTSVGAVESGAYDAVGYAAAREGLAEAGGITAGHVSLPPESYVEVTALTTGRTILVRIVERAPPGGPLILLSPDAAAQLGIAVPAPVRVRRVNPSAQEEALLRRGERAPARLDAPPALLAALRKRLPETMASRTMRPATAPSTNAEQSAPSNAVVPLANAEPIRASNSASKVKNGRYVVQVAAFSKEVRATALARSLNGHVAAGGGFWRVRLGPFGNQSEAQAAARHLAGKGFENARIMVIDAR